MIEPRGGATPDEIQRGSEAYAVYGAAVGWKTYDGRTMPPWFDLSHSVRNGWVAVGRMHRDAVSRETSVIPALVAVLVDEYDQGGMSDSRLAELIRAVKEVYDYGS